MTALASFAKSLAGDKEGTYLHVDNMSLDTATTITAGKPASISVYQPWVSDNIKGVLSAHPCAVWEDLVIKVIPGQGVFGRAVTFHCGWSHDGEPAPKTLSDMTRFDGYRCHTYGGAADPGEADRVFTARFNGGRSDVLKMRQFPVGGRTCFYYCFTEAKFGTVQIDAERFNLVVEGNFSVYGRN